jgi:hypothetical protein
MSDFYKLTNPNDDIWHGLRLPVRVRLSAACSRLIETGILQRSDLMELGGVSKPQATLDIKKIMAHAPNFMKYDNRRKCYILQSAED